MTQAVNAAAPPAQAPQPSQGNQQPAVLAPWPFPVGVFGTQNQADYDETRTLGAAEVRFPDVRVEPDGWTRGVWLIIDIISTGNTAAVAFKANAPFCGLTKILFKDTGGTEIFGSIDGYDGMTTNKFGGYFAMGDPRADITFSATTGTGGGGGSAHWAQWIPLEISQADALGTVENRSENSLYRIQLSASALADLYSTAPNGVVKMEIRTAQDSFTEPVTALALNGRTIAQAPPSPGTLQYWQTENDAMPAATGNMIISNGIGYGYRTIVLRAVDASDGTRATADTNWPDPLEVLLGTVRLGLISKSLWLTKQSRNFRLTNATPDTANGRENGVFPLWFDQDTSLIPGNEARRKYLRTKTGNTFKVRGHFGATAELNVLSNWVVPRGADFSTVVA